MRQLLSIGASVLFAACINGGGSTSDDTSGDDGDDVPPGDDGVDSLTPQLFLEEVIMRECAKAFACEAEYPDGFGVFYEDWGVSESDCLTDDDDYLARDAIAASVAAGRITFDMSAARTCFTTLQFPASCTEFFTTYDWPAACYATLVGNIADGAACTTDWDCGPDSDCATGVCD